MAGNTYPQNFIGPIRPQDRRAPSGFIGPTFSQPNNVSRGSVLGASTSSGGGGGGGGQPSGGGQVFQGAEDAARAENDALLSSLNTEFDRNKSALEGQLGYLDTQKTGALSSLDTELQGLTKQVGRSKEDSTLATNREVEEAGTVARDVQARNRNTLRALGILNSSAAGELLSKPLNEFDRQRGQLIEANLRRAEQLDDFMNQKTAEHANAVKEIQAQYAQLVGQIQNDLRFNDRQRVDAIRSANAALLQRVNEIKQAQFNYSQQVNTVKSSIAQGINETVNSYAAPQADTGSILSQAFNPAAAQSPQSIGIAQDARKKNNNFLSSAFNTA